MSPKQLRFAILCRVSTPKQKGKETPLAVQVENCERNVATLGGKIVERYIGQEHATPGNTRELFDAMLHDAKGGKFDALMLDDVSRFSRDNERAEQGLAVLRKGQIKVFIGTGEYNLADPMSKFTLSVGLSVSEMYGQTMGRKSVEGKIKRAKAGIPSTGAKPWGRSWDKEAKAWIVDEEKKQRLEDAAEAFLHEGATIKALAPRVGTSESTLMDLFRGAAGSAWSLNFNPLQNPELKESVPVTVPALLSAGVLRAIQRRLNRGPGFFRERIKRHGDDFLLRGMIFCKECGYSLSPNPQGNHRYYFHTNTSGGKDIERHFANCPAPLIEEAVVNEVFEMLGDVKRREAAMRAAHKGLSAADAVRDKIEKERRHLDDILSRQQRLVEKASRGVLSDKLIATTMGKLEEAEAAQRALIAGLEAQVTETPTKAEIEEAGKSIVKLRKSPRPSRAEMEEQIEWSYLGSAGRLRKMSFEEKRDLLRQVFGFADKPQQSRRMMKGQQTVKFTKGGVYVSRNRRGAWSYRIKGWMLGQDIRGIIEPLKVLKHSS
jgi:DNA invertase Pin-like site-specific DNA recombinase